MKYNTGVNKNVTVEIKDGQLFETIAENSSKSVTFPANRRAQFLAYLTKIDGNVMQLVVTQENKTIFTLFKEKFSSHDACHN